MSPRPVASLWSCGVPAVGDLRDNESIDGIGLGDQRSGWRPIAVSSVVKEM